MKLLYIARHFPPDGGGGVQRTLKFTKLLPDHGITSTILTGNDPRKSRYVPEDRSMCGEIDPRNSVIRVSYDSAEPTLGEKVDCLVRAGKESIAKNPPDLILVTLSPFEDIEVARRLSAYSGIRWVADLRDPWELDEFHLHRSRWHRDAAIHAMGEALSSASLIIMNTPEAAKRLLAAFPSFRKGRVVCITNGYDADDFTGPAPARIDPEIFTIVHAGALHAEKGLRQRKWSPLYSMLGRNLPGTAFLSRSHYFLLKAMERWMEIDGDRRMDVRLVLAGSSTATDRLIVDRSAVAGQVSITGYIPHVESLGQIRNADLLFLPMHTMGRGRRASIVPGKAYEYMATRRRILAAVPEGDARDFLRASGASRIVDPDDVNGMVSALRSCHADWLANGPAAPHWNEKAVRPFERRHLTEILAAELKSLCVAPPRALATA